MRLLLSSHGYPPTVSGPALIVQKIARTMAQRGHAVAVVTASDNGIPYETVDEGVTLFRVRSAPNPFWKEGPLPLVVGKSIEEIVDLWEPDVIHVQEPILIARHLLGVAARRQVPILSTCHYVPRFTTMYLPPLGELDNIAESIVWDWSIRLLNRFQVVVFANQAHRNLFVEQGLTGPTTIISNGVDTIRYRPRSGSEPDQALNGYNLPAGQRILFVSRLARDKEIDVLIQALAHIVQERETHLLLVGRGDDRERLEELTKALGLVDYVHFLGFVPEEDLPRIYRASDLFVIVSRCEVQSLPTLQAMATALPVVAANALALPELVRDGVNGYLVTPGSPEEVAQAITRILADKQLAHQMSRQSLAMVQAHTEAHTFDLYEQLYQRLAVSTMPMPVDGMQAQPARPMELNGSTPPSLGTTTLSASTPQAGDSHGAAL